jgi:hypothetical protein
MKTKFDLSPGLRSPRIRPRGVAVRAWPRALLLLLLACVLMQGTAVQAHLHPAPAGLATTAALGGPVSIGAAGKGDAQTACALCVEAAMAGHYVLGTAHALPPPPEGAVGIDPRSLPEFRLLGHSHGWLSRAPPR